MLSSFNHLNDVYIYRNLLHASVLSDCGRDFPLPLYHFIERKKIDQV